MRLTNDKRSRVNATRQPSPPPPPSGGRSNFDFIWRRKSVLLLPFRAKIVVGFFSRQKCWEFLFRAKIIAGFFFRAKILAAFLFARRNCRFALKSTPYSSLKTFFFPGEFTTIFLSALPCWKHLWFSLSFLLRYFPYFLVLRLLTLLALTHCCWFLEIIFVRVEPY